MSWSIYTNESGEPDRVGSGDGRIAIDEEHGYGARITLERLGEPDELDGPCAITCGIYEWMMHTCYRPSFGEAEQTYASMKAELDALVEQIPLRSDPDVDRKMSDVSDAISAFVDRYP